MNCVIAIDLDGTLIPILVDFERLRSEIRALLGIDHPLRPLGESLASLNIDNCLKKKAWELIEKVELESVHRLNPRDLGSNIEAVRKLVEKGLTVFIVTMRSTTTARAVLEKLELRVDALKLITRDVSPYRLVQLRSVLESGVQVERLIFIGDTIYDEMAAKTLGINFIKVSSHKELPKAIDKALELCQTMQ